MCHFNARVHQDHGNAANVKGTAPINGTTCELRNGEDVAHKLAETEHNLQQLGKQHINVAHKVTVVEVNKLWTVQGQRLDAIDDDLNGVGNKVCQRREGTAKVWLWKLRRRWQDQLEQSAGADERIQQHSDQSNHVLFEAACGTVPARKVTPLHFALRWKVATDETVGKVPCKLQYSSNQRDDRGWKACQVEAWIGRRPWSWTPRDGSVGWTLR